VNIDGETEIQLPTTRRIGNCGGVRNQEGLSESNREVLVS
jgi:hypothetical protein